MTTTEKAARLLGISGSLRKGSCNTAILEALRLRLAANGKAEMSLLGLADIPPYNGDTDAELSPASVQAMRRAMEDSDAVVLASPEYNFGTSGVLKNALDWASRPAFNGVLKGKPVLLITSSPGMTGGVRALYQLRETLTSCLARVQLPPDVVIPGVFQKMVEGVFADETVLAFAEAQIDRLIAETRRPAA